MSIAEIVGSSTGILFLILTIIQIAPIKIDPWSTIARRLGNAINHDITKELNEIKYDVKTIKIESAENRAIESRIRILRFNDELLQDMKHSKDYYDQILSDIDTYEKYCEKNPDFKNNMTVFAVENIKKCYKNCLTKHKFL